MANCQKVLQTIGRMLGVSSDYVQNNIQVIEGEQGYVVTFNNPEQRNGLVAALNKDHPEWNVTLTSESAVIPYGHENAMEAYANSLTYQYMGHQTKFLNGTYRV